MVVRPDTQLLHGSMDLRHSLGDLGDVKMSIPGRMSFWGLEIGLVFTNCAPFWGCKVRRWTGAEVNTGTCGQLLLLSSPWCADHDVRAGMFVRAWIVSGRAQVCVLVLVR